MLVTQATRLPCLQIICAAGSGESQGPSSLRRGQAEWMKHVPNRALGEQGHGYLGWPGNAVSYNAVGGFGKMSF